MGVNDKLSPAILTAPPNLTDTNFAGSVILLAMHETDGAMGFIISQASNLSFHELLADLSIEPKIDEQRVLSGGPVSKSSGFVMYEHKKRRPIAPGISLCDTMSISPSRELLEMAAAGALPGRFDLILGYAGWGPGQLDKEIANGGWMLSPFFPEILFDVPLRDRWFQSFAHLGISPLGFTHVPGGAQA